MFRILDDRQTPHVSQDTENDLRIKMWLIALRKRDVFVEEKMQMIKSRLRKRA